MSTVLVTGAAGHLGQRVATRLAALAWVDRVIAVDRFKMPSTAPTLEVHQIDLAAAMAAEELAALAKTAQAVLHLAWADPGSGNLAVLRNVLDAVEAVEPAQFVHLSSATVYGAWPDNPVPLTEQARPRPNPQFAFGVEKRAAEEMVERWEAAHPEPLVAVLRPACTLGSSEQPLPCAFTVRGRSRAAAAEERLVQFLHVDDLASAVVHAFELGLRGTYNVAPDTGAPEATAAALSGRARALPAPLGNLLHGPARRGPGRMSGARPYSEHTWVISPDKLRRTGWKPEYSSEEALVVTDRHRHWDDLPQSNRVSMTLGAAASALLALGAGGAVWWRHRD